MTRRGMGQRYGRREYPGPMTNANARIAPSDALNNGQKDCLRLVMQHFSSKEIARNLGVSPHTVDKRLKQAILALGVQSRVEAARILTRDEGEQEFRFPCTDATKPVYASAKSEDQPLVYQSPDLSQFPRIGNSGASTGEWNPAADRSDGMLRESQSAFVSRPAGQPRSGFLGLVPGEANRVNDLSVTARIVAMAGIVSGSIMAFAVFISVIEGLSRLY
jgi:DNA-binding CsgD family transcriptional regulator